MNERYDIPFIFPNISLIVINVQGKEYNVKDMLRILNGRVLKRHKFKKRMLQFEERVLVSPFRINLI